MDDKRITLVITTETLMHSLVKDIITVSTIASGIVLNTLTIHVDWLNFWLGLMAIVFTICRVLNESNKRVIRGNTPDEVITLLRERLKGENYDQQT